MKKKISLCTRFGLLMAVGLFISACDSNMPDTQAHLNKDSNKADELFNTTHRVIEQQSLVSHSNDFFVASKSYQIEENIVLPPVFDQKIIYSSAKQEGITTMLGDVYSQTGINFKFTPDAIAYMTGTSAAAPKTPGSNAVAVTTTTAPAGGAHEGGGTGLTQQTVEVGASAVNANVAVLGNVRLNMQYAGTFYEFVDRLGTQFDLYWDYLPKTKTVEFYRTRSKVFALDLLPGITTFSNNISSSSTVGGGGGSDTGANLNSGAVMTVNYSNDKGNSWLDTVATIQAMLSPEGVVNPTIDSNYVTVSDIPERVARVESYINKINDKARKKIAVKVDVFDVVLNASTDYGIDWDVVIGALGGDFTFDSGPTTSPIGTTNLTDTIKFTFTGGDGFVKSVSAIFKALSTVGDTTRVTGTTVYTVNGEPAPVQVVRRQDYVKEISFSAVSQNSSTTEVSVTPGTVISGFFLVVTPTILSDSQILLNLSFSLSTADVKTNIATVCAAGQTTNCPTITLPVVDSKNFMESVTLNPGQTVILSGFQEVENQIGISSLAAPAWWALGGNKGASAKKTTTVTVITPYIIGR